MTIFSIFVLNCIFAAQLNNICIGSHNLHGFKKSVKYHKDCLSMHKGVWFSQELWLQESQLSQLQQLDVQFAARSGMGNATSAGILRGRPFGGVAIAWSHDLDHVIRPFANFRHKRVVAVELQCESEKLLLISVYMPFFDAGNNEECLAETQDALSMIDLLIDNHPHHLLIIGGDLNTELKGESPFDPLWKDMMIRNLLSSCRSEFSSPGYTYFHESLGHKKFNDHFLMSETLMANGRVSDFCVLDEGSNLSDHLPITMQLNVPISANEFIPIPITKKPTLRWDKLNPDDISAYTQRLSTAVDEMARTRGLLAQHVCLDKCHCTNENCRYFLQQEYDDLLSCIKAADAALPKHKPGCKKDWWSSALSDLKKQSQEIHKLWIEEGKPRSGPTNAERIRIRSFYKRSIREAQRLPRQDAWNKIHTSMENDDKNGFWNSWRSLYNKHNSQFAPVVEGCSSKAAIADAFRQSFQANSKPNNDNKVNELNERFASRYEQYDAIHNNNCTCSDYKASLKGVIDAICSMQSGKCADEENVQAEHFKFSSLNFLERLTILFNAMLTHSYVPHQFRRGYMLPIAKDVHGNLGDVSNYRGITISPMMTKVLEFILKGLFEEHLSTSSLQFGFKKKHSTSHALFCFKETVNYYVNHGSHVYCSFLDASKAFDRLVHSGLFLKMLDKKVPKIFIDLVITWYDGLLCRVLWDGQYSDWFAVTAGVRQGGVLSPNFYGLYVDDLICILQSSNVGCYFLGKFAAALIYADDIAILAPSLRGLQKLLSLCERYCLEWDIKLNAGKTKNMSFGSKTQPPSELVLNGSAIEWATKWKYLGVTILHGVHFGCCVDETLRKFYRASNAILRVDGRSDDIVMLKLLETHCVSVLSYAIEVVTVADRKKRSKMRVAYNSIFRKLFNYSWRESVTDLQHALGRPTWEELISNRVDNFMKKCRLMPCDTLVQVLSSK